MLYLKTNGPSKLVRPLKQGIWKAWPSHGMLPDVSLEHDYEVTGLELDTLVHTAWEQEGVLGARMTGAGFGGCAIALVNKDKVEAFEEAVGKRYEEVVGYAPSFYIAEVAAGTRVLD